MKSIDKIVEYYNREIYPNIAPLEKQRLKVKNRVVMLNIGIVIFVILECFLLYYLFTYFDMGDNAFEYIGLAFGLTAFAYKIIKHYIIKKYKNNFKNEIIEKIIKQIDPKLEYDKSKPVLKSEYTQSELFRKGCDRYNGNDFVSGMLDGVKIKFSDIHAEYKTKNKNKTSWHTIFKGIFFVADFNKNFEGKYFIQPDTAERYLGAIGRALQNIRPHQGKIVRLDNREFEKEFVVSGDNQITARYILTFSMMERILGLKSKVKVPVHISLIKNRIFIAIEYNEDKFEPDPFKSLYNIEEITKYIETMQIIVGIANEFRLNDKIWGNIDV